MEREDFIVYDLMRDDKIPYDEIKWITGLTYQLSFEGESFLEHAQFRDWCLEIEY